MPSPDSATLLPHPGHSLHDCLLEAEPSLVVERRIVAALVNNTYQSLWYVPQEEVECTPVLRDSPEGARIVRRTLSFLCAMACTRIMPKSVPHLGQALGDGYFMGLGGVDLSEEDVGRIRMELARLIDNAAPIEPLRLPWKHAIKNLEALGRHDAVALLQQTNPREVDLYRCQDWYDLDHGPLCPHGGYVGEWSLEPWDRGMVLGHGSEPGTAHGGTMHRSRHLYSVYQEYRSWGEVLDVSILPQLNDLSKSRAIKEFIWVAEGLHQKKISDIAQSIHDERKRLRVVLIAGPSSSGKTTFSKRLSIQLRVLGFKPLTISLDDYFVPRELTPRDEKGNYDFEHLHAIDLEVLNKDLDDLIAGKEIELPQFDFRTGERKPSGRFLRLPPEGILVMEGIHGLNDELTRLVPQEHKFRIYTSALTQLNIDRLNRIASTDNRLIRRMVRDARYRGHSAESTLRMWPSVRKGENRNIFPFQDSADMVFNSALDYELGVLKPYVDPLLKSVSPLSPAYAEARRLLDFLDEFLPIPAEYVPEHSILREFIGGSAFKY